MSKYENPDFVLHEAWALQEERPVNWGIFSNPLTYVVIIVIIVVILISVSLSRNSLGSGFTGNATSDSWFQSLERPPGMPPDYLFGIVWGILYIGLLLAAILAVNYFAPANRIAFVFCLLIIFTLLWVISFTVLENLVIGLIILVITIIITLVLLRQLRPANTRSINVIARYFPIVILSLFLLWVSYATYLNAAYIGANPSAL